MCLFHSCSKQVQICPKYKAELRDEQMYSSWQAVYQHHRKIADLLLIPATKRSLWQTSELLTFVQWFKNLLICILYEDENEKENTLQ